jgi:hypothetical protein
MIASIRFALSAIHVVDKHPFHSFHSFQSGEVYGLIF